jgi:DNA-binding phage protein
MNDKVTQVNNGESVVISTTAFLQTTHDLAESNEKVKQLQDLLEQTQAEYAKLLSEVIEARSLIAAICEKFKMSKQELHRQYLQEENP